MSRKPLVLLLLIMPAGLANAGEPPSKHRADSGREDASAAIREASMPLLRSLRKAGGGEDNHPNLAEVYRFMGFIEGRLGVRPPEWWESFLTTAVTHSEIGIVFPLPDDFNWPDDKYQVALEGQELVVETEEVEFRIPKPGRFGKVSERAAANLHAQTAFMTLYSWPPIPYKIYAASRSSGRMLWTAEVRACGKLNYSGPGWHFVELRAQDDIVAVFGCSGDALYLEAFDAETSDPVCRFKIGR